jgi:hypothetical protein
MTMAKIVYLYETSKEGQDFVRGVVESLDYEVNLHVETNTLCSSIDIILDNPEIIISAYNLTGLNGVESYDSFRRKKIPIIYYTSTPELVYESLKDKLGGIPSDVYCIDKKGNPRHLKRLVDSILNG